MIPDDPYVCPVVSGSRIVTMAFMNRSRDLKKPRCNPIMEGLKKTQGRNWSFWVWSKIPGLNIGTMHGNTVIKWEHHEAHESNHIQGALWPALHWLILSSEGRQATLCEDSSFGHSRSGFETCLELFACDHSRLCFWFMLKFAFQNGQIATVVLHSVRDEDEFAHFGYDTTLVVAKGL